MDFMSDRLHNNIRFRTFNVIDDYNREVLGIDIGTSIPSLRVIRYLDQLAEWHGYPKQIRVDSGTEFTSHVFTEWASAHGIYIDYSSLAVLIRMLILNSLIAVIAMRF